MPHRWLEDIAIADAAFEAWAATPEALLAEAGEATLGVMVEDPAAVQRRVRREVRLADEPDLLLLQLLQRVLWHKDAERLLLHVGPLELEQGERGRWAVRAELWGEEIDPARHDLLTDVKAVTLHRLFVGRDPGEAGAWRARVVLDV